MADFISIGRDWLQAELCVPDFEKGYYRGTRFDHSGIFRKISGGGHVYADQWFDKEDPYRHDNVCGPSEEFVIAAGSDSAGKDNLLKIGVGLISKTAGESYDRFRLYEVLDAGKRGLRHGSDFAEFSHLMKGRYLYVKRIEIAGNGVMTIRHILCNLSDKILDTYSYNHNFFTLDGMEVGPDTRIDFNYCPTGTWREVMEEVSIEDRSIVYAKPMTRGGRTAFIGDLSSSDDFSFTIRNLKSGAGVEVRPSTHVEYSVFWCNHSVSCIEPYIHINIRPKEEFCWDIRYRFF